MLGFTPSYLPKQDLRLYRVFSILLYTLFLGVLIYGTLSFLFPYQRYTFDFNNPDATKNNLFEHHLKSRSFPEKGKVPANEQLFFYANNPQVLESGDIHITLTNPSQSKTLTGTVVTVRRGFAATFFPQGERLNTPARNIVEYQGNFYDWQDTTLFPFVSQAAAESYLPKEHIQSIPESLFAGLTKSEELIGFRPGTLLAYADGVFFVTEEGTIRPFGSAEVLLRAGYSFNHVISASGEDVGIYKRGKIILPGELHLGGTLFFDTDTEQTFLFQDKTMHPLTPAYADFLRSKNDTITFSSQATRKETTCTLETTWFRQNLRCSLDVTVLHGPGNDYQFALSAVPEETDFKTIELGLQSSRKPENARATLRSLSNRILERLGLY